MSIRGIVICDGCGTQGQRGVREGAVSTPARWRIRNRARLDGWWCGWHKGDKFPTDLCRICREKYPNTKRIK